MDGLVRLSSQVRESQLDGTVADAAMTSVSTVVEHFFRQHPSVARRAGRHEFDGRLPGVDRRSVDEIDRMLFVATNHLQALPESVDPELRADVAAAVKLLDHERFRVAVLGRDRPGPLDLLAEADVAVYLSRSYAPLAERVDALGDHLAGLPDFLARAGRTLGDRLPAGERLRGVEQARSQAVGIRNVVQDLQERGLEPARPRLAAIASSAAGACERYAAAVAETKPARAVLGPELLAEFLRAAEGITHPVADLLDEAEAEVAAVRSALDSAAARLGVGNRDEAYQLMARKFSDRPVLESFKSTTDRLEAFWRQQDVVSVVAATPLQLRHPQQPGGSAAVSFDAAGRLEQVTQPHIVYVPVLTDSPEQNGVSLRRQYFNDPMLEMIAVHEVFAGHYVHAEASLRGPSVLRTCLPCFPGISEGWAHYVEELAIEHGLADGRPLIEVAQLRFALEAATRLFIHLSVHMGRMTFTEAVDRAIALCGWSMERAAREVLIVVSDPFGAMYTLGKLRIREWRKTAAAGAVSWNLKGFHDRLLRAGLVPLAVAWQYHLDGQRDPRSASAKESL
ncbi:hypothetical protein [Alloactinosynnema sp. L-07]|uniref:DUF885 family protein n=1 Tax=Alloactinosynnema sp. L-07 TaxID=1653480 RepID=UPI00065EF970|nr:DUF885 family protein [Alloactinosynnema sp. L-07]CRK56738.1 hypothetical protein [Alloactinosynnema sp. L-07]